MLPGASLCAHMYNAHTDNNMYIRTQNNTSFLLAYECPHLNLKINKILENLNIILIFLIGLLLIQNDPI